MQTWGDAKFLAISDERLRQITARFFSVNDAEFTIRFHNEAMNKKCPFILWTNYKVLDNIVQYMRERTYYKVEDGLKLCPACNVIKKLNRFYKRSDRVGVSALCYHSHCKKCECYATSKRAALNPNHFTRRNRKILNEIKLSRGCADCGYNSHPAALDFDHIGEKSFPMHLAVNKKEEVFLKEIEKCEVVCANCHRIRTQNRPRKHKRKTVSIEDD